MMLGVTSSIECEIRLNFKKYVIFKNHYDHSYKYIKWKQHTQKKSRFGNNADKNEKREIDKTNIISYSVFINKVTKTDENQRRQNVFFEFFFQESSSKYIFVYKYSINNFLIGIKKGGGGGGEINFTSPSSSFYETIFLPSFQQQNSPFFFYY